MRRHRLCGSFSGVVGMLFLLVLLSLQVMDVYAFWPEFSWRRRSTTQVTARESKQEEVLGTNSRKTTSKIPLDMDSPAIVIGNNKGKELYEHSTSLMAGHSCWQMAYSGMATSCREILKDENKKSRLALGLTDCFLKTSGRPGLCKCDEKAPLTSCVRALDDHVHSIFLAFFIDAASMCHFLQSEEFKLETENVVNQLKRTAHDTEIKLNLINSQLDGQHTYVVEHTEYILEAQKQMQAKQLVLQSTLEEGIVNLQDATHEATKEIRVVNDIQKELGRQQQEIAQGIAFELTEVQRQSTELGSSVSGLYGTVEEMAAASLAGHEHAMKSFADLQRLQIDAVEQSKLSMKALATEARKHHEEFGSWQSELDSMQRRLIQGSSDMLKAQEAIAVKQSNVFKTLEKLFSLHNAILLEGRLFKTVLVYFAAGILVFMVTTTKQTRNARLLLYFGWFVTLTFEIWLIRFKVPELNSQEETFTWPPRKIVSVRYAYGALSLAYLLYCYASFRDYDKLNHNMLKMNHKFLQEVKEKQDDLRKAILKEVREEVRGMKGNVASRTRSKCGCKEHSEAASKSIPAKERKTRFYDCPPDRDSGSEPSIRKPARRARTSPY